MTKDHTHLFEANSKKYAFDSERLVAVSLDDITYDLLTDLKNGQVNSSEYCKYEKALVEESNRSLQEVIKDSPKPFPSNRLSFLYCIFLKICRPAVSV